MDEMSKNMSFEYGDDPKFREQETGHVYFKEAADESTEPFAKNVKLKAHTEYTAHKNGKIGEGGDDGTSAILDDLIEGKSGIHLVSNAESVVDGAFACTSISRDGPIIGIGLYLESVSLPNATSIGDGAFNHCSDLTNVDLPNATSIGKRVFDECSALTSVDLPNVTSIGDGAFNHCSDLTNVDLPNATSIGDGAFNHCSDLTNVDLPNATSIGKRVFAGCSALTSVDLPNVTSIGDNAFADCAALTSVDLPNATSIGEHAFNGISSDAVINLGAAEGEISGAPWGAPNGVTINYNVRPTQEG